MRPRGVRRLLRLPSRSTRDIEADLRDEFELHLDLRTQDLIEQGLAPGAARAQARKEFGDLDHGFAACLAHDRLAERRRGVRTFAAELRQDAIYGVRLLARTRAFSVVGILTLAVAIGANTAVFSVLNALVLKPLPIRDPASLVRLYPGESAMSWPNIIDVRQRTDTLEGVIAQRNIVPGVAVTGSDPARITGAIVSRNYFEVLGVAPLAGHTFRSGDPRSDLVVVGERFWRTRLRGDPAAVGSTIDIDGRRHEIIAIMPRAFRGVSPAGFGRDLWIPADPAGAHRRLMADRGSTGFEAYARLRSGVDHAAATASLRVVGAQLKSEHPQLNQRFDRLQALPTSGVSGLRGISALLPVIAFVTLAGVIAILILLVACANLAGLLLGRAAARGREIAVRVALGAGRRRIVRQLITESLILAVLGAAAGLLIATWMTAAVPLATRRLPFPLEFDLAVDRKVLLYTTLIAGLAAILFGLVPARRASRADVVTGLKEDGGGRSAGGRQRAWAGLVVAQVAACTALLVWGGLFVRSLGNVATVDPGFDVHNVLVIELPIADMAGSNEDDEARVRVAREWQGIAGAMPGVQSVGMTFAVPLTFMSRAEYSIRLPGAEDVQPAPRVMANVVTPGYFDTIRIRRVAGRDFTWQDRHDTPRVAIVNETAARRWWNGQAVGRRFDIPERDEWTTVEVVGVVRDSKYWTLGEQIQPTVYTPYAQGVMGNSLLVRTANPDTTSAALRRELRRAAPNLPIEITRLQDATAVAVIPARIGAIVTTVFGAVAMVLALMGLYGMVTFNVARRVREIGVRKALGAGTADVVRALLGSGLTLVLAGMGLGVGLGSLAAGAFGGLIVDVSPFDIPTVVVVLGSVGLTALLASLVPALHAARVDPMMALRIE